MLFCKNYQYASSVFFFNDFVNHEMLYAYIENGTHIFPIFKCGQSTVGNPILVYKLFEERQLALENPIFR